MSEIVDDFKISNVEITNELGINLTSDTSRIKHTGNNEFNITSSGEINVRTENKNGGNDCDINLYAGDGLDVDEEGGDIRLEAGNGDGSGGDIEINAGNGGNRGGYIEMYAGNGVDDDGGDIEIISGNSTNYSGGDIDIYGGDGKLSGGDVYIEAGEKTGDNGNKGANVEIRGGYANGSGQGGDVVIYGGYGDDGESYGDIKISNGPSQKIGFFGNDPVIRPASNGETNGVSTPGGDANLRHDSTFTGNVGDKAYTISDIVKALKQLGFLDSDVALPGLAPAALPVPQPRVSRKEQKQKAGKNSTEDN